MAYIAPNSDVYILKGVPLDRSYNHTLLQSTETAQYNTFYSYRKYTLTNQSYQRAGKGKIRVALLADNLYDCNYIMFKNTSYGSKWFYAFIDSVDYINDNATEINYTIDVMQTWYFDYELGSCYVEREHSLTDNIGENLVPENIDTGDLIPVSNWKFVYPNSISSAGIMYELVVFYVPNNSKGYISGIKIESGETIYEITQCKSGNTYNTGTIVNGIYMGCKYWGIPLLLGADIDKTREEIDNLIAKILGTDVGGSIVNIVQVPYNLWTYWITYGGSTATRDSIHYMARRNWNSSFTAYYEPKNNKLFTYPFRSIVVSNNAGQTATFKWEYFTEKKATFKITGVPIMSPELMCYPYNYRGIKDDYESGLVLTDFPTPPWSEDSFAKWWAQNKDAYITSLVSTSVLAIGAVIATVATGGAAASAAAGAGASAGLTGAQTATIVGTSLGAGSKIANSIGTFTTAKNTPDQISGQAGVSSLRTVQNRIGFNFHDMGVEMDKAKVIDGYFSMFGYAVKQVKVPNVRASGVTLRPHWNYVKTTACIIHSASGKGLPAEDEEAISNIYDNGITFWTNASEVGNYELDNSPTI